MDTKQKYGIRNAQGLLLFAQLVLVKIGLVIQLLVLLTLILNHLDTYMLISNISMIIAHLGVFVYCYIGFKKSRVFYYVTVGLFLIAIFINICMPFRDIAQIALLTALFGMMSVFMFKQEDFVFTNVLITLAAMASLGFGIYSCVIAKVDNLGNNVMGMASVIVMYLSIFAPLIMVGLFGAAYNARYTKVHHLADKTAKEMIKEEYKKCRKSE